MKKRRIYDILLLICVLVFLGSGSVLIYKVIAQKKNDGRLEALSDLVNDGFEESGQTAANGPADGGAGGDTADAETAQDKAQAMREARVNAYQKIREQNSDLVGWVKIEGTKIDYPVLQTPDDPNFYLKHDFDKKTSVYGAPYVAEECDLSQDCKNIVIYGHHMKNGSMFASLDEYLDPAYREAHPIVQFDTLEEYGDYEVMAVFAINAADPDNPLYRYISGANEEVFGEYVSYVQQHSAYDMGVTAEWGDHLLSLVTCEYTHKDGRLIVVAKKIEQ